MLRLCTWFSLLAAAARGLALRQTILERFQRPTPLADDIEVVAEALTTQELSITDWINLITTREAID
jgi:hypothetical protein